MKKFFATVLSMMLVLSIFAGSAFAAIEPFAFTIKNTGYNFSQMDKSCRNKKVYKDQSWSMIIDSFSVTSGTFGQKLV